MAGNSTTRKPRIAIWSASVNRKIDGEAARIVVLAQQLTQNSKGTLYRNPLFSRLTSPPKLVLVPAALTGPWQKEWASNYRCPEAYKRIDRWCAQHNHPSLVACLAHLHQQMRLATIAEVGRGRSPRLAKTALLPMVKSHRRHRSRQLANRERLLRRHLGHLVDMGLARSGSKWVEFVDSSEMPFLDTAIQKSIGQNASQTPLEPIYRCGSLKIIKGRRGEHARQQVRDGCGRFGARCPPTPFRPEAGSAAPQPPSFEDKFFVSCNPEPVVVEVPVPEPKAVVAVAGNAVPASANYFLARAQAIVDGVSRETLVERERRWAEAEARHAAAKAQSSHRVTSASVRDALATAPVLRAVDRPDDGAMPVGLKAPQSPPRGTRGQLGTQIPQAERRVHDRALCRLSELLGAPTLTPDDAALCRSPASGADFAILFGQVGYLTLAKMRAVRCSPAAWYQAREHMAHSCAVGVRDWRACLRKAARQYQVYFDGRDGGWSPYRAHQKAARRGHRLKTPER